MRTSVVLVFSVIASGCGGSRAAEPPRAPVEKPAPAARPVPEPAPAAAVESATLPTACAGGGDICTMPKAFVNRLCQATFPNVALVLFGKGAPWTHGYMTRKTQGWNAEGGASVQSFLEFDEEVLLLTSHTPPKGGMQVTGAGGYQGLRWDGSCVTLSSEEVTTQKPPSPKHPRIEWRWIDDGMRDALRKDPRVDEAYVAWHKECKGISVGDVSKKCVTEDQKLGDAIVKFVVNTGGLPDPAKLP
jgi:hypothetical protein